MAGRVTSVSPHDDVNHVEVYFIEHGEIVGERTRDIVRLHNLLHSVFVEFGDSFNRDAAKAIDARVMAALRTPARADKADFLASLTSIKLECNNQQIIKADANNSVLLEFFYSFLVSS